MAKVQWSVLVTSAIGRAGTVIASSGPFGATLRPPVSLAYSATISQQLARQAFATASQLWKDASMYPYRPGWILLGVNHPEPNVFGTLIKKTGLQWFTRANKTRDTFGLAPILAAPAFVTVTDPAAVTVTPDLGTPALTIGVTAPPNASTEGVIIKATRGLSPGRTVMSNTAKIVRTIAPGDTGPWDIYTEYLTKFGEPVPDLQIFAQVYYVNIASGKPGTPRFGGSVWS